MNVFNNMEKEVRLSMADSIDIAKEIAICDRLIDSPDVPESVKTEMKTKKMRLLDLKIQNDNYIINNTIKN